jgi:hypothetical protein
MLPILRTISVGGVLLAITILGLALIPPGRPHGQFADAGATARGALIDRGTHPEWRQFLILSALKRADELERLHDLPDRPVALPDAPNGPPAEAPQQLAGLPSPHEAAEPEDITGTIDVAPSATIPIDIGETSSFELPVSPTEERLPVATSPVVNTTTSDTLSPPVAAVPVIEPPLSKVAALTLPEHAKPVVIIRKRVVRKPAPKPPVAAAEISVPPPFNFLQAFFASLAGKSTAVAEQPAKGAVLRRPRNNAKQTAGIQ